MERRREARTAQERSGAMARANPVPKFYKSVIDDVIESVQDVFVEEGIDEQVLKELKRRWEAKVVQSKATDGFFQHSHISPQFMLNLTPNFNQALQTSAGFVAGRGIRQFTTPTATAAAELGASRAGAAILTLPSGLAYPIQIPAGVTLQTTSGQLYKVNMPMVVTQASGGGTVLQNPVQQIFQQLGRQPSVPPSAVQANTSSLRAAGRESLQAPKSAASEQMGMPEKVLCGAAVMQEAVGSQGKTSTGTLVSQRPSSSPDPSRNANVQMATPTLKSPEADRTTATTEVMAGSLSDEGDLAVNLEHLLDPDGIVELIIMGNELDDSAFLTDESNLSFAEQLPFQQEAAIANKSHPASFQLDTNVQMEPQKDVANDLSQIIQLDGTGDDSPKGEIGSPRDGDDEELIGIIDAEDLKVLDEEEEEGENSTSDKQSLSSTSDTDDPSVDITEEDPLNSGDDVSEQETPGVFDTDNIIVCQYDKVQRSKNRWKFYLKDGVLCFKGKDYIFSKATGDAEW